jgi:hypothetical protein
MRVIIGEDRKDLKTEDKTFFNDDVEVGHPIKLTFPLTPKSMRVAFVKDRKEEVWFCYLKHEPHI